MTDSKKKVSIMVPCYNEEENVVPISEALVAQMEALPRYDYEILFIDNCSTDNTRPLLRQICARNKRIKAIFNVKNFGQFNSPYYGMLQTTGDCVISICADFQDPVEMIPTFLKYWEDGYQIVHGVKTSSQESGIMYRLRSIYYKLIKKYVDHLKNEMGKNRKVICGYEAGCLGYSLYRQLTGVGIDCVILAPTTMERPVSYPFKNDKRDAISVARCLANHGYKAVYVPTPEDEAVKEYIRMRDDHAAALKRIKQQILAFCTRHGNISPKGRITGRKSTLRG
jgi:glycosyltransferase involved in cell wall biosynthesis